MTVIILLIAVRIGFFEKPVENIALPELRVELLKRVEMDQEARFTMINWMKDHPEPKDEKAKGEWKVEFEKRSLNVRKADIENTKRMQEIVEKHGWPTHAMVGKDGAHSAWLLIQHADMNRGFQRTCLDLMQKLPRDQTSAIDIAYLTDRVLLAEGKKQVNGTQFELVDNEWKPRNLEDPSNVDKRRKEAGLPPLAEYAKSLEELYGNPGKKK